MDSFNLAKELFLNCDPKEWNRVIMITIKQIKVPFYKQLLLDIMVKDPKKRLKISEILKRIKAYMR